MKKCNCTRTILLPCCNNCITYFICIIAYFITYFLSKYE